MGGAASGAVLDLGSDGDRHGGLYGDAVRDDARGAEGASRAWRDPGHRRIRRCRQRCRGRARQARLHGDRGVGPSRKPGLSEEPRRLRLRLPRGTYRQGQAAEQDPVGRCRRRRGRGHARQYVVDDSVWRRGRGDGPDRRRRSPGDRLSVHSAQRDSRRRRFRFLPEAAPCRSVAASGRGSSRCRHRSGCAIRSRSRAFHRRRATSWRTASRAGW